MTAQKKKVKISHRKTKKAAAKRPTKKTKARAAAAPRKVKREQPKARPKTEAAAPVKSPLTKKELEHYRQKLQALRDRIIDEIGFLTGDTLNRSQRDSSGDLSSYSFHIADQGTDNFDREFALNLASSEQETLYEIDEALAKIDMNTYGVCEMCGCAIEKARLDAMPYARMCVKCKAQSEKGKTHYRSFGPAFSEAHLLEQ